MKDAWNCSRAWLPFLPMDIPAGSTPAQIARTQTESGLRSLCIESPFVLLPRCKGEAYHLSQDAGVITISGGEPGVLYGICEALCRLAGGHEIQSG